MALDALVDDLVAANHVLADAGALDGFGHVSARHPERPDRFLIARSLAPSQVAADDVMTLDLDGNAVDGDARRPYLERFIHGAIYRRRPDVHAVVHSHAVAVVPFAASDVPLRPVYHMGGFLGAGAPVFEIRERFGDTDLLVRNAVQADALADALGASAVVLMRGHGFVAAAPSVPLAVYRALYTVANAAAQRDAIALGGCVRYLSAEEAERADATNRAVVERPWSLWKEEAARRRRPR